MNIDFKEIPQANKSDGQQDTFELFARDFLKACGYEIIEQPGRGADGGRDLLAREQLTSINTTHPVVWLVSAKHYAHSGKAVGSSDELNIASRVRRADANGFMGFYSTLPTSDLSRIFRSESRDFFVEHYDHASIEARLLSSPNLEHIFRQYFPSSHAAFLHAGGYRSLVRPLSANPSIDEIIDTVLHSDPKADWERHASPDKLTTSCRHDSNLRFEHSYGEDGCQNKNFQESWANDFPNPQAVGYYYTLYYGPTPIRTFILVGVDEGWRALLPLLDRETLKFDELDYRVAQIHDYLGTLEEYLSLVRMRRT